MDILEALQNVPPPPCVGCRHFERCAQRQHACHAYYQYAQEGEYQSDLRRMPNSKWFAAIDDAMDRRVLKLIRRRPKKLQINRERVNKRAAIHGFVCRHPNGIRAGIVLEAMTSLGIERGYIFKCLLALRDAGQLRCVRSESRATRVEDVLWFPL